MCLGQVGQGGAPASLPGLSGTNYWYDYRQAHGKLFRLQGGSSNVNVNLADLIEINNGGLRDELAGSVFLFQNDKTSGDINFTGGGIADIRPTTAQGGATVDPGFAAICTLNPHASTRFALLVAAWNRAADTGATAAQVARLLPTLPATGSRDGRIAKFSGNTLQWAIDTVGATAAQIARLLPTLPATGSRDDKILKFDGDDLGWEDDTGGGGTTEAVYAQFPITALQNIAILTAATPSRLLIGAASKSLDTSGEIGRTAATGLINLGAGSFRITAFMIVDGKNLGGNGRTTFEIGMYESDGTLIENRQPATGYERNILNPLNRSAHMAQFVITNTEAKSISMRAKTFQVDDNGTSVHQTQTGSYIYVEKLGGPRGERGLPGSGGGGAETLYGAGTPAAALGEEDLSLIHI